MFQPGQSGNPSGRPKMDPALRQKLKEAVGPALERAISLIGSQDENIALKAVNLVLDRALGKPAQALEHSGPDGEAIQIEGPSDNDLARRIAFVLAKATKA